MKVSFKQACSIDGKEFGPSMRRTPGIFEVPGYFIFIDFFVSLMNDGKLKIEKIEDADFENLPEKYKDIQPHESILEVLSKFHDLKMASSEKANEEQAEILVKAKEEKKKGKK